MIFRTILLAAILFFSRCTTEAPVYPFTITVVNENGVALPNVFVEATADVPNAMPQFTGITDENGTISFTYEYEAVLKIRATRGNNPPSWMGCNFVKLIADKPVNSTVVLLPFDPSQPGC